MNNELNNMLEEMTKAENLIIPDSEFGDLIINTITGKISGDKLNYSEKKIYNDFPIEYKMNEFEITELECCDLEKLKSLFAENLHFILI